ncbi:TetR/AcrR family transcriptional regulator [Cryptosporangium sp. NPDC051539]|uniref:TetR/AcrR family transcriptional regulator n=1 Tax=Cryptosporangium sp. NPDC051539 TaxID=3363962 RepID=UPI0037915547
MPRGTVDPERPLRIALAALDVVADKGVEGLTHRAVAAVAGIPLGSTTYHFQTLDDLLAAAVVEAKRVTDAEMAAWARQLGPGTDLAAAVTDYVMHTLTDRWGRLVVEHELYMAALRRPHLQPLSREWDEAFPTVLSRHTDAVTAETVAMVVDGMFVRALIHGMPSRDQVEVVLRRLLP